jgi:hypothetical protein
LESKYNNFTIEAQALLQQKKKKKQKRRKTKKEKKPKKFMFVTMLGRLYLPNVFKEK